MLPRSRREFLTTAGGLAVVASVARRGRSQAAPGASLDEWPQFRGNPRLTGTAGGSPPPLAVLWTHEAGADGIESSAAIVGGRVYVGSQSGKLLALDLQSGKLLWAYETGAEIGESSPCVSGGTVYVGDLAGVLHAVSARDGKATWTFKTGAEIRASPVVAGGSVLVGGYDNRLHALDPKTGASRWFFETDGQVHATSAVDAGLAYVAGCDGELRAIRVADGKQAFSIPSGGYTGASPALQGGRAFYGTFEDEVLGVDLEARKVAWRYQHEQRRFPFYSSAALGDGKVVLGGRDKHVHALDAGHRQGRVDLRDPRARRLVSRDRWRSRVRGLGGRAALRPRPEDGRPRRELRGRGRDHRVSRDRGGPPGGGDGRRPAPLLRPEGLIRPGGALRLDRRRELSHNDRIGAFHSKEIVRGREHSPCLRREGGPPGRRDRFPHAGRRLAGLAWPEP